jgi:hypothetical protein
MPIAVHDDEKTTPLGEEPFKDEEELQACFERSPYLLVSESEPPVATVGREVSLPSAGILDLLAVDKDGLPVAVEVKLARNAKSRREVVAQAFDYVADLSELTFDELDDLVDGALAGALQELVGPEQVVAVRKQCATNLRAGRIRVVIAVDSASEDLIRIVHDLRHNRRMDVRLVSVRKYQGGRILVPQILVGAAAPAAPGGKPLKRPAEAEAGAGSAPARGRRVSCVKEPDPAFVAVGDAYDRIAEQELKTRNRHHPQRREIHPYGWPPHLHYAFIDYPREVGIELHLQSKDLRGLAAVLDPISGQEVGHGNSLAWLPNRQRLRAKVQKGLDPEVGARAMRELIALTREVVQKYLNA